MANHKIMRFGTSGQWMVVLDGDRGMPEGGFPRQILTKVSGADFIAQWNDPVGFTFTQGQAPTLGLDGSSALTTGSTWWDTTTNNGYVRVSTQWVQFSWGDSEARYVNVTGDTLTGQLSGIAPTAAPNLTRKDYVDAQVATAAANANTRVAKAGDTMSGALTFTNTLATKIQLYDGYTFGIEGSTIRYTSMAGSGNHSFSGQIDATGRIQSASFVRAEGGYVAADTDVHVRNINKQGHRVRLGAWTGDGTWTGMYGNRGYILIDNTAGAGNMHVRGNNTLYLGGDGNDQLYMYGGSSPAMRSTAAHYFSSSITVDAGASVGHALSCGHGFSAGHHITAGHGFTCNSGQIIGHMANSGGGHGDMPIQCRLTSGFVGGFSSWLQQYGQAPTMQNNGGVGEMFEFKNNAATDYNWVKAGAFITPSSRELKVNVRSATQENLDRGYDALKNVRSVVYDHAVGELHIRATERFRDVNRRWKAMGHEPLLLTREHTVSVPHDCEESDKCCGTADAPCGVSTRHQDRRGFIAEELMGVLPNALAYDLQNEPIGIDYAVLTVELWDIVKHLNERVEELEAQLVK